MTRDPYDGSPFFCTWCGAEYRWCGCCCELETEAEAEERAWLHAAEIPTLQPITTTVAKLSAPEFGGAEVIEEHGRK